MSNDGQLLALITATQDRAVEANAPRSAIVLLIKLAKIAPNTFLGQQWRLFDAKRTAKVTGLAEKTIRRAVADLECIGILEMRKHGHMREYRMTNPPALGPGRDSEA